MKPSYDLTLYLVTDPVLCAARGVVATATAAARGGATIVQLRDKEAPDDALIETAIALKAALAPLGAPLIVNDRIAVAAAAGRRRDPCRPRRRGGGGGARGARPDKIIGLSLNTGEHARRVDRSVVDYVGCGPIRPTPTKGDHKTPIGVDGAAALKAQAGLPAVGIGGVDAALAGALAAAGLDGAAVVSAICGADDPEAAAHAIRQAIDAGKARGVTGHDTNPRNEPA